MPAATVLGEIVRIDDRSVPVLGQEPDVAKSQPDIANALLHRVDDTLFVVDTGVTVAGGGSNYRAVVGL
ncbi:hypothetical protein, partial [Intrasporangium sp.]|uniref:hypothetical protein n=1 Tax=Intrasporangium sp. TaxID=1925024 RepID=UPI003222118C